LPEIRCRSVELAATQEAQNHQPVHSAASKLLKQHNAKRRTYFFNAIGHERPILLDGWTSALDPIASVESVIRRVKFGQPCARPMLATLEALCRYPQPGFAQNDDL
jgi:hypothetical protein